VSNEQLTPVGVEFTTKDKQAFIDDMNEAINAYDELIATNKKAAESYRAAEVAGLRYDKAQKQFVDTVTGFVVTQEAAGKRLAQAKQFLEQAAEAGFHYNTALDKFVDTARNVVVSTDKVEAGIKRMNREGRRIPQALSSSEFRDFASAASEALTGTRDFGDALVQIITAGSLVGAVLAVAALAFKQIADQVKKSNEFFIAENQYILRTSASLDEYIAKRRQAAAASFDREALDLALGATGEFADRLGKSFVQGRGQARGFIGDLLGGINAAKTAQDAYNQSIEEASKKYDDVAKNQFALHPLLDEQLETLRLQTLELAKQEYLTAGEEDETRRARNLKAIYDNLVEQGKLLGTIVEKDGKLLELDRDRKVTIPLNTQALLDQAKAIQLQGREMAKVAESQRVMRAAATEFANQQIQAVSDINRVLAQAAESIGQARTERDTALLEAEENFQDALAKIDEDGNKQRTNLARDLAEQLAKLDEDLQKQRQDAAEQLQETLVKAEEDAQKERAAAAVSLAESLASAEEQTQKQREEAHESFRDQGVKIEEAYAEQVRQVTEQFNDSLEDIVSRRDAKALRDALRTKQKGLEDATRTRDKDRADAQKSYDKQQADLTKSLNEQKAQLQKDYQRRLQDLAKSLNEQRAEAQKGYAKQLADLAESRAEQEREARKSHAKQLADLARSQAEQRETERQSYAQRQQEIQASFQQRTQAIGAALAKETELMRSYGAQIKQALRDALDPAEYAQAIQGLQDALNAKIEIKITRLATSGGSGGQSGTGQPGFTAFQQGGFVPHEQIARLHPNEVVVPLSPRERARATELVERYIVPAGLTETQTVSAVGAPTAAGLQRSVSLNVDIGGVVRFEGAVTAQMQQIANQQIKAAFETALKGVRLRSLF
jgi:hypothetical protein